MVWTSCAFLRGKMLSSLLNYSTHVLTNFEYRAEEDPVHPWCLTESQDWVGSDIVRADCSTNPSDPTCGGNASAIAAENSRMANLYDDTLVRAALLLLTNLLTIAT